MTKNFVEELKWRGMLAQMMPGTEDYLRNRWCLLIWAQIQRQTPYILVTCVAL